MLNVNDVDSAIEILENSTSKGYLRIEALFTLMNFPYEKSLNAVFKCLREDKCELVRHEAAFCLGEMASTDAINVLKVVFEDDDSLVVKHECLMSLGTIGGFSEVEFAKKVFGDERFEVSCSAKICAQRIEQTEDFFGEFEDNFDSYSVRLFDCVKSSQNDRIQIIFQLMRIGTDECVELIGKSLKDDICRVVRHEAAFVLGEIGTKRAIEILVDACGSDATAIVVHEAIFALGTTGEKNVVVFLEKFLGDENYVVSESARIAIDRINLLEKPYSGREEFEYLKRNK